ncbi:MAG: TonB family protein [Bacteroidota bacterium]|nr:TonB family protein [Bacteroidota bacterium]
MTGWHYLLLVNIYLLLFYGFYVLLLRKETFFQLNRVYLVAASLLSFFIPMIQSNWVKNLFITKEVQLRIYNSPLVVYQFKPIQHSEVTIGQFVAAIYLAGMIFLIGRFIWQMVVLNKLINQPDSAIAYSFFKKIRLAKDQADNKVIAAHEHVHAKQWHSADVLLIEAVMIINWFNPVVYLYRFSIKHIHEYIADRQALKCGTNKTDYALLLLSQTFNTPVHSLVNPFYNHSLLKQRIRMLQKNKSKHVALVKYGLSVPLFILMLVLSSATVSNSQTVGFVSKKVSQVLLTPASAIQPNIILDSTTMVHDDTVETQSVIHNAPERITIEEAPKRNASGESSNSPVFTSVEMVPQFPGGLEGFGHYLSKNIRYPAAMREQGVQGKVIIGFIVEKDGSLSNIQVRRGVADEIDKEALRVISESPKWAPGIQNGRPVRVQYSVPISFTLVDDDKPNNSGTAPMIAENRASFKGVAMNPTTDTIKRDKVLKMKNLMTNPLYVVDGKVVDNIIGLSPDDIESISVLPKSAAKAVYGPKGENGVVAIATKKDTAKPSPVKSPDIKH